MKKLLFIFLFILFSLTSHGHGGAFRFIENKGQWNEKIKFKSDIPGGALFLEKNSFTYHLLDTKVLKKLHPYRDSIPLKDLKINGHSFKVHFENSNPEASVDGEYSYQDYYNYFQGKDRSKWASNVKAYGIVSYQELYDGIDLKVYRVDDNLKYDFVVLPGSSPSVIKLKYEGVDKIFLKEGNLVCVTSVGNVVEKHPYAYQITDGRSTKVSCNFKVTNNEVSFEFPNGYDRSKKLIIDPTLVFSTYSGSFADNFGYTATFDSEGNLYSGSSAFGVGYPVTPGAYQTTFKGGSPFFTLGTDVAITKYDSSGTFRQYSTYLGGEFDELPHSMIVNGKDELLIFGTTASSNFPISPNAYDSIFAGGKDVSMFGIGVRYPNGCDIFITKLSASGGILLASTYVGGTANDGLLMISDDTLTSLRYNYADEVRGEIEIDKDDNVYIASCTRSTDFPTTASYQPIYKGGKFDAITFKMSPDLSQLVWSTFLGGTASDAAYSLEIDTLHNIYITGGTTSTDFPTTAGVINPVMPGFVDGFIAHLDSNGNSLLNSTYYGSFTYDQTYLLDLDRFNNVYIFGQTMAPGNTFVFNAAYSVPNSGQFISKLQPDLSSLIWSTTFGNGSGRPNISPTAFLVDLCAAVYLSGWGGTPNNNEFLNGLTRRFDNMPKSADAFQSTTDQKDFYLFVLKDDASAFSYASFFGGNISDEHVDGGTSRFDRKGKIYQAMCAGCGGNSDLPVKPAYGTAFLPDSNNSFNCNSAVFKMDFNLPIVVADFTAEPACSGDVVQFVNKSLEQSVTKFKWSFGDGGASTLKNPTHTYANGGTYNVTLIVSDNKTCNLADTITKSIYISPFPVNVTVTATVDQDTIFKKHSTVLHAFPQPGFLYDWSPAGSLNNSHIPNPIATPDTTTTYTVTVSDPLLSNCRLSAAVKVNVVEIVCGEPIIFVPDAFTPDEDGKNDILFVRGKNIKEFFFTVYDRWGEKVFETRDLEKGWDGTYKGMKADPGVFVFYLDVTCIDDQKFFKKGNVTLIR